MRSSNDSTSGADMSYLEFNLNEPEERKEQYREHMRLNSLGVRKSAELVLRALQLMAPSQPLHQYGVVFALARHVAEEVDAISILLEKGSVEPCKAHLRSAFEADLAVRFILESDSERRALAYRVKEIRERLRFNDKFDARTETGKAIRAAIVSDPIGADVVASMPAHDFDSENDRLKSLLAEPPLDAIEALWRTAGKRAEWYSIFGGRRSIRELAYSLGRAFWYEFLYSEWSGRLHAGRTLTAFGVNRTEPSRKGEAIRPIRQPDGISTVYNIGQGIAVDLALRISERYLSPIGRDDLRSFFLQELRPINDRVRSMEIKADWH